MVQRADGTCLYHLASVVDDIEMAITHVIRAEEHLSNTPRQIWIWRGLGVEPPELAHLPVVAEPGSKVKLSKRKLDKYLKNPEFAGLYEHGRRIAERLGLEVAAETFNPVIVDFYRDRRVPARRDPQLPDAARLVARRRDRDPLGARSGSPHFTLDGVNKSPASFDPQKLLSFQERYMQALPADERFAALPAVRRARGVDREPAVRGRACRRPARSSRPPASASRSPATSSTTTSSSVADDAIEYDKRPSRSAFASRTSATELLRRDPRRARLAPDFDPFHWKLLSRASSRPAASASARSSTPCASP